MGGPPPSEATRAALSEGRAGLGGTRSASMSTLRRTYGEKSCNEPGIPIKPPSPSRDTRHMFGVERTQGTCLSPRCGAEGLGGRSGWTMMGGQWGKASCATNSCRTKCMDAAPLPYLKGKTPGLSHSASDPGLRKPSALQSAGAGAVSTLYERMLTGGQFKDTPHEAKHVRPGGCSTAVMNDSTAMDLQSDIYFPAPPTPPHEKKFRKSSVPGEIHVHHGLKEQKLPSKDFAYGARGFKGPTVGETMKAGQLMGVAEYKNSVAERVYESNKREPLGTSYIRGHDVSKMLPEGYGNFSGVPEDAKRTLFPIDRERDSDEVRRQYVRTHQSHAPGERIQRDYNWPDGTADPFFRFGIAQKPKGNEGVGVCMALNLDVEDDGHMKRTRMVQRGCEDYRQVEHPKFEHTKHYKQGALGPPLPPDHRYGVKSGKDGVSAKNCIRGYYTLAEQLPDQDLGRCLKMGRRNMTTETRAFGCPSVRSDIAGPRPGKRSLADVTNYGDEVAACALLNPQRFSSLGVPDEDFLLRRPKDELHSLVMKTGILQCPVKTVRCAKCGAIVGNEQSAEEEEFDAMWDRARALFQDDIDQVSLDALLYVYSAAIDGQVQRKHNGNGTGDRGLLHPAADTKPNCCEAFVAAHS